jgi:hypothetical protein
MVYVVDKFRRIVFLRAFRNFSKYVKFLGDKNGFVKSSHTYDNVTSTFESARSKAYLVLYTASASIPLAQPAQRESPVKRDTGGFQKC